MVIAVDPREFPFHSQFMTVRNHDFHYIDKGAGDPVVMIHGNPTWSFYFRNAIRDLSPYVRTIALDHLGCGLSGRPKEADYGYTLKDRVDDLEDFLDQLGVCENITLMVHDWGGMIGMGFATRHPERIKKLIISNTAAFHLPENMRFPRALRLFRNRVIGPTLVRGLNAFNLGAARYCVTRGKMPPAVRQAYLAPYTSWESRAAVFRFVADIPLRPGDQSYGTVSEIEHNLHRLAHVPKLICWGGRDFIFDDHFLNKWRQIYPEATVICVPDAGHYLFEDAWTIVEPEIKEFLGLPTDQDDQRRPTH